MKIAIASFICGMLVAGGTATAAVKSAYWKEGGASYVCEGVYSGVGCKERAWSGIYGVWVTRSFVAITRHGKVVAACRRGFAMDCTARDGSAIR